MNRRKLEYRFQSEPTNPHGPPYKTSIPRPVISVRLSHGGKSTPQFSVLVDSGSDANCFNTQVADALGIDWKRCPEVNYKGISGGTTGFIREVRVEIGGYSYEADAVFIENLPRLGLMGVCGFLDRFECRLNREQETIEIYFNEEGGRVISRAG